MTWYAHGQPIKPSAYFQTELLPTGDAKLIIAKAYPEDAGEYTARVLNPAGEVTATTQLTVEGERMTCAFTDRLVRKESLIE